MTFVSHCHGHHGARTFSVGLLQEVTEIEPNNDFAKPQPIPMNVTVNGVAANEDIDYYAVKAKKGERITAEIEGIRLGLTLFDPYVAILNSRRFELASSDDSALVSAGRTGLGDRAEDGTYIIVAREAAYAGNANCLYRLHVGNFPRPTAVVPSGGKIGESLTVRWIGDVLGERTTRLTLPAALDHHFGLLAHDGQGTAPFCKHLPAQPVWQHDGIRAERRAGHGDTVHAAGRPERGDRNAGRCRSLRVSGQERGNVQHSRLREADSLAARFGAVDRGENGGRVASNDDTGGPDSYVRFVAPGDGEYVLTMTDQLKKAARITRIASRSRPVAPRLRVEHAQRIAPPRHGHDGPGRAAGQPPGHPDQRRAVPIRGALALAASRAPCRRDVRVRYDRRRQRCRSRPLHRGAGCPCGGVARHGLGPAADPETGGPE